jgi:hypothetical protein
VTTSEQTRLEPYQHATDRLTVILERALRAYHRDERHGGASWMGERILDVELTPVAREAFRNADEMPPDREVLNVLDGESVQLLGEGYHVVALVEPGRRFVAKYAKHHAPVPPLAPAAEHSTRQDWVQDHGVRPDGTLHPAIWQHIRAFEAYGPLAVPSRVYFADSALECLSTDERRSLARFRSIGIVRSLGSAPRLIRVRYPDDFPLEKRAPDGVTVSVLVVQPEVIPLAVAIERSLRAGDVERARDLQARYDQFIQQLWRFGVSHLDFSILNVGILGSGQAERFQIFDPHIGEIASSEGEREARDPLSEGQSGTRSLDKILRSARDGSRWALWRVQQDVTASGDVPQEGAEEAGTMVREFHEASDGIEQGEGSFGLHRFDRTWAQRRAHHINTVLHAQLWKLLKHPLGELMRFLIEPSTSEAVYDRSLTVLGMHDDGPLAQFRAGLKLYEERPLILIGNVAEDTSRLVKHWGRLRLPPELDVQNDPSIHYHLRDLFTGEMYVRSGEDLSQRGFVFGLAPHELHVLQLEDVTVEDLAVERVLAVQHDISEFLGDCTKRVGVVGDVHGELQALQEILRALGFIDSSRQWCARDGTLVFTGDVGHGQHLQEVFDFIHRLAAEAHRLAGRIVWTLGNHDLYVDREGGQGGEASLGYRLWPEIREAALHPERHPGLIVQAAYFGHGKLFVHGGILPNIVDLAMRERGARDAEAVASYVNEMFQRTLVERERIAARDLPHEIFHVGTSHARERRYPGEIGYEPAGVFTPDLRELDHYRYHDTLLPQVVGHTASRRGEIRYSPESWLRRDYIAIDVGRQHGTGNGGLLLTDFGWVAVVPGGPARLVEVGPLFVRLAHQAAGAPSPEIREGVRLERVLRAYFRAARPESRARESVQEALFLDLSPPQIVALERFLSAVRQTGRCALITDLDEMLTAFSEGDLEQDTIEILADYVAVGGILLFSTDSSFDVFYDRLLRPLILELGPRSGLLAQVLLILSGGSEIFAFEDGAYRLLSVDPGRDRAEAFDALVGVSNEGRFSGLPVLDRDTAVYLGNSFAPGGIDEAMAGKVGTVINVGDAMLEVARQPISNLHRGYRRTIELIGAATAALHHSGRAARPPTPPKIGDLVLWTFEQRRFQRGARLRVRVGASGFVHAGVVRADAGWDPVYNVPLVPVPEGGYEAVLPAGIDAFTFFWTEEPWSPGHRGHWERGLRGGRVFKAGDR